MNPRVVQWLDGFLPHSVAVTLAPGWFFCIGLAGLVSLAWMLALARRHRIDRGAVATIVLWVYVAAVAAGILMPMLIDAIQQRIATGHVHLRWAGMTSFWGYLAGAAAITIVCRDHDISLARLGDLAAAPIGGALALARIGCFLAGCDYGKVTSVPWAVRFPAGSPAFRDQVAAGLLPADRAESLPVHPTQLYESLLGIAMVVLALLIARRRVRDGGVFVAVVALYAIGRIAIEVLRADLGRGIYAGLSSGQIFSLCVLVAIAASWLRPRRVLTAAVAASVVLLLVAGDADAQPAPNDPYAQPQPQPQPYYPPPQYYPPPPPPIPMVEVKSESSIEVGALLGIAVPINRRQDQVPMLAGPALSAGYVLPPHVGVYVDYDSYANTEATHGTLMVSGAGMASSGPFHFGGRAGIGRTVVNFHAAGFMDVAGTSLRVEAIAEYDLNDTFVAWVRPLSIDTLEARDLGGPIVTWQMSAGIAYRLRTKKHVPAPGASTALPPPAPPPPPAAPAPGAQP